MSSLFSDSKWPLQALGRTYNPKLGKMLRPVPETEADRGGPYLRAGLLDWGGLVTDDLPLMWANQREIVEYGVRVGDLVVAEGGDAGRATILPEIPSETIIQNSLHRIRGDYAELRFLYYVLSAIHSSGWLEAACNKATIGHLTGEKLSSLPIPTPNRQDRDRVVDFLDRETSRTRHLIALKDRLRSSLQDRFLSAVDRATATGRETRVRHVTSLITSGPRGWSDVVGDEGEPFIRSGDLRETSIRMRVDGLVRVRPETRQEGARSRVDAGDICVGITGANTGWVGMVPARLAGGYVSQHVALLRPRGVKGEWLAFSLLGRRVREQLLAAQYGGTKQLLGLDDLAEVRIFVPDLREAHRILRWLRDLENSTERTRERLNQQVSVLQERVQALVTAAVTGQLDVTKFEAA